MTKYVAGNDSFPVITTVHGVKELITLLQMIKHVAMLNMQPPPGLNDVEHKKWVEKHTRYRDPPRPGKTSHYGINYCPTNQQSPTPNTVNPNHQFIVPTHRGENLHEQQLPDTTQPISNITRDPRKRKSPMRDTDLLKEKKKGKEIAYYHNPCTYVTEDSLQMHQDADISHANDQNPIYIAPAFYNYEQDLTDLGTNVSLENAYHHVPFTSGAKGCSKIQDYAPIYKPFDHYQDLFTTQPCDSEGEFTCSLPGDNYSQTQQHSLYQLLSHQHAQGPMPHHAVTEGQCVNDSNTMRNEIKRNNKPFTRSYADRKRQRPPDMTVSNKRPCSFKKQQTSESSSYSSLHSTNEGGSHFYIDIGDADYACHYCKAMFWYGERLKGSSHKYYPKYTKCCGGGQVQLRKEPDPPEYFKYLFKDKHFLENIRAYNHMFTRVQHEADIKKCKFKQEKEQVINEHVLQIPVT
ncbi:hypothetical protein CTI12_AA077140 [Artemisia annua]|uniref:Helitron helicase-like domain-containing protein n=1 Tax=Artemisia annua TaxID=35608 RepID=A0A2U1Q4N4_ARTAN|nr:hypothetical protein CTI12_AA077140 [Artemisia annua]